MKYRSKIGTPSEPVLPTIPALALTLRICLPFRKYSPQPDDSQTVNHLRASKVSFMTFTSPPNTVPAISADALSR